MKLLRIVLILVLAVAVPGTALAALASDGHCRMAPASAAAHAPHVSNDADQQAGHGTHADHMASQAQHAGHGAGAGDSTHCRCGCSCMGTHCVPGGGAALAMAPGLLPAVAAGDAEFPSPRFLPLRAHSRNLLRPPSTT